MAFVDDELLSFEAVGAPPLPVPKVSGHLENHGAQLWYSSYGEGEPVVLLHGGLGHSGNWGHQVPALVARGYRVIAIDSRGHGRSTRDAQTFTYDLMGSDVLAVLDALALDRALLVGWSDGACTAMVLGASHPDRVAGVFFFACNMDPGGTRPFQPTAAINRCFARHKKDYERLSATPGHFQQLMDDLGTMQRTQPNYSAQDLARVRVPVLIVQSEGDEFIRFEHARYLADTIPGASLQRLEQVTHFAPLQRPDDFNAAVLAFANRIYTK